MAVNGVQITTNLTNSRWAKYLPDYIRAAMFNRVYDVLAKPVGRDMSDLYRGSSIVLNFLSDLEPGTSAIPEDQDVTPVSFRDATATITPTSRYNAIQVSELLMNSASTNYAQERFEMQVVNPEKYQAWRDSKLVFDNTPLTDVVHTIRDYYGVRITVGDSLLGARQFTGTLPNDDLEVILLALSTAYKIDVVREKNNIILK